MKVKTKDYRVLSTLIICVVVIMFYTLMTFTPLYSDDYNYVYVYGTNLRISNITDVCVSQYNHYFKHHGRIIPTFLTQVFDGMLDKSIFNVVNTLFFIAFLWLLANQVKDKRPYHFSPIILSLFLIVVFIPGFNMVFLWLNGSCNYLWVAVQLLLFHHLMEKEVFSYKWLPLLFVYGVICGWSNEGIVLGLAVGYVFHYCIHKKELTRHRIVLLSGLLIGIVFLVFAPGSIHRFFEGRGAFSVSVIIHQLLSALIDMRNLRLLPLLLVILLIAGAFKSVKWDFFTDNDLWIVAISISFFFVLLTGHTAPHSRFGIELFSMIVLLRFFARFIIPPSIMIILGLTAFFVLSQTLYYSYLNCQEYKHCVFQMKKTSTGLVETNEVKWPSFFDRLILRYMYDENSDYYEAYNGDRWIERYYGTDKLCFLPHRFLVKVHSNLSNFYDFDVETDLPFYVKRVNTDSVNKVVFHLAETDMASVPFFLRPFAHKMERYSARQIETKKFSVVSLPEGKFLLITKNHMISDRVANITVE